jgi:hypothetical protein
MPTIVTIFGQDENFELRDDVPMLDLKKQIMRKTGIPIERQQLTFEDHIIRDGKRLTCAILVFSN